VDDFNEKQLIITNTDGTHGFLDAWGNPIVYSYYFWKYKDGVFQNKNYKSESFDLQSFGPNGIDDVGKKDDITNY